MAHFLEFCNKGSAVYVETNRVNIAHLTAQYWKKNNHKKIKHGIDNIKTHIYCVYPTRYTMAASGVEIVITKVHEIPLFVLVCT